MSLRKPPTDLIHLEDEIQWVLTKMKTVAENYLGKPTNQDKKKRGDYNSRGFQRCPTESTKNAGHQQQLP
jgi:hypothetical protein